jgi:hypothetical protein
MTEQAPEELHPYADDAEPLAEAETMHPAGPAPTGVSSVDRVLGELTGLDERPLEEHVDAFERAHEALRAALDASPDPTPDDLA